MKHYISRVSDRKGKISHITRSAPDDKALAKLISDEGLFLISCAETQGRGRKSFSARIILDFTDTMALMLRSGLTVRDSLKVAASSFKDNKTGQLISTLRQSLNKGISFPDALDMMSDDFTPLYRGMVRIGDQTGSMENVYGKLSAYLNDDKAMKEKISGALIYPVLVLSVMFLGMIAVIFFIFPRLRNTYADQSVNVIFERFQLMMNIFLIPMTIIILAFIFLFLASRSKGTLKRMADLIFLKAPLFGKISLIRSSLNIVFSLEVLTASGFPIESAIRESSNILRNAVLKEALERIGQAIIKGDNLSHAFDREKAFPKRIPVWIGIGEASGDVGAVFSQLRTYFQGELDKMTSRIMLLIEPVLIVMVGVFMILFVILFVVPLLGIFGAAV